MKYQIEYVDIDSLEPDPNQPRKKFDKEAINNLAQTIETQNIINPIEIDTNNIIITGEMRWRAAKVAGLKKIRVNRITEITEAEIFERQVIENLHHNELSSKEKQGAVLRLWNSKKYKTREELAKTIGLNASWVNRLIKLPEIKKEIGINSASKLDTTTIIDIDELLKKDIVAKRALAKKAVEENLKREDVREIARTIKKVPKDIKEEILKPKSEITIQEAKEIAEFPKPEQRKQVMEQIKRTKQVAKKIIQEEKEVAKKEKPSPVIKVENIDKRKIDLMQDIFFRITQEYRDNDIKEYNNMTQRKCIEIMRKAYQFIFQEVEKYGKRYME